MAAEKPVSYERLGTELLARFPQLFPGYAALKAMWDGDEPGPHVLFEDLLVPYLLDLFQHGDSELQLVEAFGFLEELAEPSEPIVRDLLGASVLEGLQQEQASWSLARGYMGPRTRRMAEEIDRAWGP